jgi:hypothetical protein
MEMNDLRQQIADLTPAKRALLERRLAETRLVAVGARAIPRRAGPGPCALSFAQQRLWFLDQLQPDSSVYNIAKAVRLRGS